MKCIKQVLMMGVAALPLFGNAAASVDGTSRSRTPNVIVILVDDLGYADLGCQGSPDVKTPHIDTLAANGVRCTDGYVTAPQCGPSRAGLLSGRYQNRFGFESNEFAYDPGFPRSQKMISERMKELGYVTGYMGKWGVTSKRHSYPLQRGFDECYWNQDGNLYFPDTPSQYNVQVKRGNDPVEQPAYSTDAFGREAVNFIKRHKDESFFLMVSFIAPHVPMEAKQEDLERFPDVEDELRRTMLGMVACMDDNVGRMLDTLKKEKLEEDTLIFFLSDNGGYALNASRNDPFRGGKSQMLEGGIREPFLIQWKGTLPAGKVYEEPVISLDILPTALTAAGAEIKPEWELDGVNLLPFLSGEEQGVPHDALFWRYNVWTTKPEKDAWAIREGDWMLVRNGWAQTPPALYNLADDPGQRNDLSKAQPERFYRMRKRWEAWDAKNAKPGSVK